MRYFVLFNATLGTSNFTEILMKFRVQISFSSPFFWIVSDICLCVHMKSDGLWIEGASSPNRPFFQYKGRLKSQSLSMTSSHWKVNTNGVLQSQRSCTAITDDDYIMCLALTFLPLYPFSLTLTETFGFGWDQLACPYGYFQIDYNLLYNFFGRRTRSGVLQRCSLLASI